MFYVNNLSQCITAGSDGNLLVHDEAEAEAVLIRWVSSKAMTGSVPGRSLLPKSIFRFPFAIVQVEEAHPCDITALAYSSEGGIVATGDSQGNIKVGSFSLLTALTFLPS